MWKQQLQLLQIKPLVTHLRHAPHFPERLTEFILIIYTSQHSQIHKAQLFTLPSIGTQSELRLCPAQFMKL